MKATHEAAAPGLLALAQQGKLNQDLDTAKTVAQATLNHAAVMEPKYDGIRLLAVVDDEGKCRTFTRAGNEQTGKLPAIEAALADGLPPGSVLDGEAVAFDLKDGRLVQVWGRAQSVLGSGVAKAALGSGCITFVAFDLLAHGGIDARGVSLGKRRDLLERVFEAAAFDPSRVTLTPQVAATEEAHVALLEAGYEGSVVKHLDSVYASGQRGKGWLRLKPQDTVDAVVTGYKPGEDGFVGYVGAVHFGQYDDDGILVERGKCSGMDWDTRVYITEHQDECLNRVIEVAHHGAMPPTKAKPLGALRNPQFKRWRDDRLPESVKIHDK